MAQVRACSLEKRGKCQADEASKPPPAPYRARGSINSALQKRWKLGAVLLALISVRCASAAASG